MDSLEDYPATIKNGENPSEGSILEAILPSSLNIARAGPVCCDMICKCVFELCGID